MENAENKETKKFTISITSFAHLFFLIMLCVGGFAAGVILMLSNGHTLLLERIEYSGGIVIKYVLTFYDKVNAIAGFAFGIILVSLALFGAALIIKKGGVFFEPKPKS